MFTSGPCENCLYFTYKVVDGKSTAFCLKKQGSATPSADCTGFKYKTEYITVDIRRVRVKDNERFKSTYPASTDSKVIVSTSIDSIAAVLEIKVSESSRKQIKKEVEKIKTAKVTKGNEKSTCWFALDTIIVRVKKSWEY